MLKNPLILALDLDDEKKALNLADSLSDLVGGFKIGPRLFFKKGPSIIKKLKSLAPVFLDMKFLDIPSTVKASVTASFEMGCSMVSVHAWGGRGLIEPLAELEKKLAKERFFKILFVSALSCYELDDLVEIGFSDKSISDHINRIFKPAYQLGLKGIVCATQELNNLPKDIFSVVPGIRLQGNNEHDQKRVASPKEAVSNGASAIVVGRSILLDKDPIMITKKILSDISSCG